MILHKKEYLFSELKQKLLRHGFEITESGGICPMRESLASGQFDLDEMQRFPVLDPDPEVCYLLYFKCRKG